MASRSYTAEFKKQAVELAATLGSTKKAADQLGIPDVNISVWKKRLSTSGSKEHGVRKEAPDQELQHLRKENAELKHVNFILKTAAAFFSQDHLKKNIR